jgi:Arc/MetJ family transcription regulator
MHTIRTTMNLDAELVREASRQHPTMTRTAVIEEGLRALLARDAALRLAAIGGTAPKSRRPKRLPRAKR